MALPRFSEGLGIGANALGAACAGLLASTQVHAAEAVDLALILAVDVSESVDRQEAAQQREGYIQAIQSPDVIAAIRSGPEGRIAVAYIEWAGPDHFFVVLDWSVIDGPESAGRFAMRLQAEEVTRGFTTSITALMRRAPALFASLPMRTARYVLDISGDGPNNDGGYVLHARERLIRAGVTINGLPILNERPAPSGYPRFEDLAGYFKHCVVGGAGSFQIEAESFDDFAVAIQLKLVQEIASRPPPRHSGHRLLHLVSAAPEYDCTIGEKQSRDRLRRKFQSTGGSRNGDSRNGDSRNGDSRNGERP